MGGSASEPRRVLIAGGGVAGLETCLALRDLAGDHVRCSLLTPEEEFAYRPMAVGEPFGRGQAQRHGLDAIAEQLGGKAWLRGPHDDDPGAAERRALFWPPTKIAGRYLSPFLLALAETAGQATEPDGQAVELDLERDVPAAADALRTARRR